MNLSWDIFFQNQGKKSMGDLPPPPLVTHIFCYFPGVEKENYDMK